MQGPRSSVWTIDNDAERTDNVTATLPHVVSGYQVASDLFEINDVGVVSVRSTEIADNGVANLAKIDDPEGPSTFTFNVNIFVDTVPGTDANTSILVPDPEAAARMARKGFVAANENDLTNDLDEVNTLSVTVRILKAPQDNEFAAIPASAAQNDLLYGKQGQLMGVALKGLTGGMTVIAVTDETVNDSAVANADQAIYGEADAQNVVWLKYGEGDTETDPAITNDSPLLGEGASPIVTSSPAEVTFTIRVDTDSTNDDKDGTETALDDQEPPQPIENILTDDRLITFTTSIDLLNVLEFATGAGAADGTADKPYSFSIRSNGEMGRQAGVIMLMGAAASEDVDVLVRGDAPFTAVPRKVGNTYDQVVVQASRQLTPADEGMHDIVVTINGRALPTRTAQANVKIQVTASNAVPVVDSTALTNGKLILSVPESDKTASETATTTTNGLITAMTGTPLTNTLIVGGDFSSYVSDDNPLTYGVDGTTAFAFKTGTSLLIPVNDLVVMGAKPAADETDNPLTTDVDESLTLYTAPGGGKFSNGEETTTVPYDDVTYGFKVVIRDSANTVEIPVELTVMANEPVSLIKATGPETYQSTDSFGFVIADLADYVSDPESGALTYTDTVVPVVAPFQLEDATGEVKVTFPGRVTGANVWALTVSVDDGFMNTFVEALNDDGTSQQPKKYEAVVDQTVTITITATEGTPPRRVPHGITVDEHTAVDTVVGSVASLIDSVDNFEEVGGSTGSDHFDVVETGDGMGNIVIKSDLDADADDAVTTMLLSVKAFGENNIELGEVSVLITIRAINEVPKFVTTDDYARSIDENAQTSATVGAVVVATDADAGADGEITYSVSNKKDVPFDVITTDDGTGQIVVDEDSKRQINILNQPYTVKVKATDGGGESATQDVVVGDPWHQ